jgi:hypothetical protein
MSRISVGRVVAGGLVAGLVMNVGEAALHAGVLGQDSEALYTTLHIPMPNPAATIPLLVGMTFLLGVVTIWLYAALYPRFESRVSTALVTGIVVWLLAHVWSGVYLGAGFAGIFTARLAWIPVIWGLFESILATFAGALVYKAPPECHPSICEGTFRVAD